jgi:AraC-like DNA-binding protein
MSYDQSLLFDAILHSLRKNPSGQLRDLSLEFHVSRRTIQKAISLVTGKTLRELREEILLEHFRTLLTSRSAFSIKELSFGLGYKSPSAFARAIKRACGFSPQELRLRVGQAGQVTKNAPQLVSR